MKDWQEIFCVLKSIWIKILIYSKENCTTLIQIILKIALDLKDLCKKGLNWISKLTLNTTNISLESWIRSSYSTWKQIRHEHKWNNPSVRIDNLLVYLKNYYIAGFTFKSDLFDNNGNLFIDRKWKSSYRMKKVNVKTSFVEYAGLKKAIFAILSKTWEMNFSLQFLYRTAYDF